MSGFRHIVIAGLVALGHTFLPEPGSGGGLQETPGDRSLYAAVFSVRGSVSGMSTGGFGVFVREGGNSWRQITLSNVFTFGLGFFQAGETRRHYIAAGNGLHRSTDGGRSWRILTSWKTMEVLSVVPHPVDSATVYIATPWGVFKTVDDGESWVEKAGGMRRWYVEDLLMDLRDSEILYAGSEDDLYRTLDGGELWEQMGLGASVLSVLQHPVRHDLLLAGVEDGGVRFTTDGGATWRTGEGLGGMSVYAIASSADGEELYAAGWETGLWRSEDEGRSWRRIWNHPDVEGIFCILVDPTNPANIYVGTDGDGVFESRDRGKSWRRAGLEGGKIKQIAIYPEEQ